MPDSTLPIRHPWNGCISIIILILKLRTLNSNQISPFPRLHSLRGRGELKFELRLLDFKSGIFSHYCSVSFFPPFLLETMSGALNW